MLSSAFSSNKTRYVDVAGYILCLMAFITLLSDIVLKYVDVLDKIGGLKQKLEDL